MTVLHSVHYSYEVIVDDDGKHYLEALCGGIAMYSVRVELTDEEVALFLADKDALDGLAKKIQYYGKRP